MASLTLRERRNSTKSKYDSIELYALIDKCLQILQNDKLLLRQQIKNGSEELIQLLNQYKKKTGNQILISLFQDLHPLQQELRKYLNRIKTKNILQSKYMGKENAYHSYQSSFASNSSSISASENRLSLNKDPNSVPSTSTQKLSKKTQSKSHTRLVAKSPFQGNNTSKNKNEPEKKFITTYKQFQSFKVKQEALLEQINKGQKDKVAQNIQRNERHEQQATNKFIDTKEYIIPTFITNATQQSPQESVHRKDNSYINFEFKNDQPEDSFFRNHSIRSIQQSDCILNQSKSFQKDEIVNQKLFNQEDSFQKSEKQFKIQKVSLSEDQQFGLNKQDSDILIQSEQIINRNDLVLASFQDLTNRFHLQSKEQSMQKSVKCETPQSISPFSKLESQHNEQQTTLDSSIRQSYNQNKINGFQLGFQYDNQRKDDSLYQGNQNRNNDNENDIMVKYASLFTSPDLLQQCKVAIKNYQTESIASQRIPQNQNKIDHSSFNYSSLENQSYQIEKEQEINNSYDSNRFESRCKQSESQNKSKFDRFKLKQFSTQLAETIFDEIFSENSLNKISRAFFRFKMESLIQDIEEDNTVDNEQLDDLFQQIDYKKDGFIDVNEMGKFLENICRWENSELKQIFNLLDQGQQGIFSEENLERTLMEVEQQGKWEDLSDLGRIYFQECDIMMNGQLTYWEFYLKKTTKTGKRIVEILREQIKIKEQQN